VNSITTIVSLTTLKRSKEASIRPGLRALSETRPNRTKEINISAARRVVNLVKESRLLSRERNLRERTTTCVMEVLILKLKLKQVHFGDVGRG